MSPVSTQARTIVKRLITDYPYWAKKVYKIRDKFNRLVPLILNDVQKRVGEAEAEELEKYGNARIYILKGRQGGISTDQQARSLHRVWRAPGASALTLAHSREDTDKIFQITRRGITNFPRDLLPRMGRSESKEVIFPGIDSRFWTGTAGAKRVGRGITLTRFHGSEFAFWDTPVPTLNSVAPAMIPQGSVIVLETTPDEFESGAHTFWNEAVAGENGYRALFFPWWECDPANYQIALLEIDELGELAEDEFLLMKTHGLSLEQIKWRRSKIKEMGVLEFMREYPEDPDSCWISSGAKFYDMDLVRRLTHRAPVPIKTEQGGNLKIYGSPQMTIEVDGEKSTYTEDVIIGGDVAEGVGADSSAWCARSFPSYRLLATFVDAHIEPDGFARMLYDWGRGKYWDLTTEESEEFREAFLIIEKNSHGITVLRKLRDLSYPRRSIYHRTPLGKNFDEKTDYVGWATTGESKPLLLDAGRDLLNAADDGHVGVPGPEALRDAMAVADGNLTGRDILVAEMLAWIGRGSVARRRVTIKKPLHW